MGKISLIFLILVSFALGQPQSSENVYNVVNYGIKTNGVTDATAPLSSVVAVISGGTTKKTLYFPAGSYRVNSKLTLDSNITLRFDYNAKLIAGDSLKIEGGIEAGLFQIFDTTGVIDLSNAKISCAYPEWWGAKGDNSTDNTSMLRKAFASMSPAVSFGGIKYLINDSVYVNLAGRQVKINSNSKSVLSLQRNTSTGNYYAPEGSLQFSNGKIDLEGITLIGNNSNQNPNTNLRSVLQITGCSKVILKDVNIYNGIYTGFQAINDSNLTVTNCTFNNNLYAGVLVRGTKGITFTNCTFSYNGYNNSYDFGGYGIAISGRFPYPYGGTPIDNENVLIKGCIANYNYRSNIDVHGGIGVKILHNFIKGFGNRAIYAVNEGGDTGYEKVVRDVLIEDNTIKNDTTWYKTLSSSSPYQYVIGVGTWGTSGDVPIDNGGTVEVIHNHISNIATADLQMAIWCYTNPNGLRMKEIRIIDNTISDTLANYQYSVIAVKNLGTDIEPQYIEISRNKIKGHATGTGVLGIYIQRGLKQVVVDNVIDGTFANSTYPDLICGTDSVLTKRGNMVNSVGLSNTSIKIPNKMIK